ncbi:cysteine alpha-hairpin motif superfamily [Terfezia claveryi]|nr:cysteine alpha-hairpin motif superfamily [Terfezia claveryi]
MSQPIVQAPAGDACPLPSKAPDTKAAAGPKPCCVCKEEKARRDECMLFSNRGEEDCKPMIDLYRTCMAGYGFKLP